MHRGFGFFRLGGLIWLVVIIIAIYLLFKFINRSKGQDSTSSKKSALNILDERYAKGEIDEEEYRRRKEFLKEE